MRHDGSLRTLIELVKLGARSRLVPLSTSELGRVLHLTQQGASVRLLELEKEGLIERGRVGRRLGVRLTSRGYDQVASLYAELKGGNEPEGGVSFHRAGILRDEGRRILRKPGRIQETVHESSRVHPVPRDAEPQARLVDSD